LYDTKAEAEAARQRLCSAVDVENVKVVDQSSASGGMGSFYLSNDDRHAYGEALRRGGALLCAEVDGDSDRDRIVQALEETSSVDLEERQRSWKQEGWTPYPETRGASAQGFAGTASGAVEEERIPIVEEELRVGKREVERGGARVRSYVREIPVQEEVTLREEHVQVERRPVEQQAAGTAATATDDMLQDRTIEMVERAEEAVVQKVANVREEVVVTKTAEERTEQIRDTVRRTEVDVQEDGRGAGDRSAFGGFSGSGRDGSDR
jgi:uncharacterized protein (TIGR02271 family)